MQLGKRFKFKMIGEDGNAFSLLGRFKEKARAHGWKPEEIKSVVDKAASGDYDNLLATLQEATNAY